MLFRIATRCTPRKALMYFPVPHVYLFTFHLLGTFYNFLSVGGWFTCGLFRSVEL